MLLPLLARLGGRAGWGRGSGVHASVNDEAASHEIRAATLSGTLPWFYRIGKVIDRSAKKRNRRKENWRKANYSLYAQPMRLKMTDAALKKLAGFRKLEKADRGPKRCTPEEWRPVLPRPLYVTGVWLERLHQVRRTECGQRHGLQPLLGSRTRRTRLWASEM